MQTYLRVLEELADGRFHSGAVLAERLALSRAAVWKATRRLADHGIEIHAVRGRGYRLATPVELFDAGRIAAEFGERASRLVTTLEVHREIDTTNRHLMAAGLAGEPGGRACVADRQSDGRGRRGRRWHSPFGRNVYLSLLWRYPVGPEVLAGLSLAVGASVARLLTEMGVPEIAVKWPNDLLCRGRKLGGILLEASGESGGPSFIVVGVGLNLGMPKEADTAIDQPWHDLLHELGDAAPGRNRLAGQLIDRLAPLLADYPESGLEPFLVEWRAFDALAGQDVELTLANSTVHGVCRGIDDSGALRLDCAGTERRFHGGEVTVRAAR